MYWFYSFFPYNKSPQFLIKYYWIIMIARNKFGFPSREENTEVKPNTEVQPIDGRNIHDFLLWAEASVFVDIKDIEVHEAEHIQPNTKNTYDTLLGLIKTLHPKSRLENLSWGRKSLQARIKLRKEIQNIIEGSNLPSIEQQELLNQLYKNSTTKKLLTILWKDKTPKVSASNKLIEKIFNQQFETEHQN